GRRTRGAAPQWHVASDQNMPVNARVRPCTKLLSPAQRSFSTLLSRQSWANRSMRLNENFGAPVKPLPRRAQTLRTERLRRGGQLREVLAEQRHRLRARPRSCAPCDGRPGPAPRFNAHETFSNPLEQATEQSSKLPSRAIPNTRRHERRA